MSALVGIIGGTGVGDRLLAMPGERTQIATPAGELIGRFVDADGVSLLVVGRHSEGHKVPPHRVNYAALALGMKEAGVRACLATAAVGSLHPEWPPGTFAVVTDFLDFSGRYPTLFNEQVVHQDFTHPTDPQVVQALRDAAPEARASAVYVCVNGPRYETPAEIRMFRQLGGDVVGMTAATEAILMREAGVFYGCISLVSNLAAGLSASELNHGEVTNAMQLHGDRLLEILFAAARRLA